MNTLALRRLSRSEVRLRQKVGAGWFYPLADDETLGGLTLRLAEPDAAPATALRTGAGTLWLSEAEAVCGVLSRCPTVITPGTEQAWYWPLWNHYLIAGARTLFGTLEPDAQAQPDAGLVWLSLEIELGEARAASRVGVEAATLERLLAQPGWVALRAEGVEEMALRLPLNLGSLTLPLAQLRALRPDDVVLPTHCGFLPSGEGEVQLGGVRIQGALQGDAGHSGHFYITDLEITDVNETPEDYAMDGVPTPEEAHTAEASTTSSAFDPLPLALTLRCGHLRLTLGEISRLSVGSTLMVDHVVPGEALLCHGEYPLAKGELVDVEGRLGLQITHMLPDAASPLGRDR